MGFILKKIEPLTRAAADRNRKLAIRRDFYCDSLFIRYNARRDAAQRPPNQMSKPAGV
jgi:hypothetical protein